MRYSAKICLSILSGAGLIAVFLAAAAAAEPLVLQLPEIDIVGATPLLGSGLDRDKVPAATHIINRDEIARAGATGLPGALDEQVGGVALNDAAGNAFQPTLMYRGFAASPLEGTAQGIAVYVNGARFNLPFGDTVNWDLFPSVAIDNANLEGANPMFGLNALGGSLSLQLRNGFTWHGGELTLSGGSFGRVGATFQYGQQSGNFAAYAAGSILHDGGWRADQSSDLHQFYGDAGWRGDRGELHFSILAARNGLNGPGTIPVELLDARRAAVFTAPNAIQNNFAQAGMNGRVDISDTTSLQAVMYYTYFSQKVTNGNTPNFQVCGDGSGFLCDQTGAFLTDRQHNPIPDFANGGPYSELDSQSVNTNGYGMSAQISNKDTLFGVPNHLVAGASFDGGVTIFTASSAAGGLTASRDFIGPGIIIAQADGSIAPVRVAVTNAYYGLFATDILDVTPRLSANVSGRVNFAQINLRDRFGTALNGNHAYAHFNPGIGLTYKLTPEITAYAGFSIANRAPTPAELSCADIASPCTLANFFVGDPNLKQVVSQTLEAGLRGQFTPYTGATLRWNAGVFRTNVIDEILFLPSPIAGRDFFQNAGPTRREGVEGGLKLQSGRLLAWIDYAFTAATFQTPFAEDSPLNPAADANGQIYIARGSQLPGVPRHRLKLGASYDVTDSWTAGFNATISSGQYLFGDEANLTPRTGGYAVLNLNTRYRISPNIQIFGMVLNVLNAKYETFGTFSDTSSIPISQIPGASNSRSLSPAPPVAAYGGVRVSF